MIAETAIFLQAFFRRNWFAFSRFEIRTEGVGGHSFDADGLELFHGARHDCQEAHPNQPGDDGGVGALFLSCVVDGFSAGPKLGLSVSENQVTQAANCPWHCALYVVDFLFLELGDDALG